MQLHTFWRRLYLHAAIFLIAAVSQKATGTSAEISSTRAETTLAILAARLPGYGGIVFTQLPSASTASGASHSTSTSRDYGEGGRLVLLDVHGGFKTLSTEFQSASDPAVSFDGKRILFSGKKASSDNWNIYEMNADGTSIRQITRSLGNCRKPLYQSALFYLNDATPSYQVTFVSDAANELNEGEGSLATNLYSMRMDGSGLRRLTYGLSSSFEPFQMQDGRILFSSWQRSKLDDGPNGRIELFGVHHDGTDIGSFSGAQGLRYKRMACTTPARKAVFVESEKLARDGAGTLATLELRRNLHSYKQLTRTADGLFVWPSPLPDGSILVSMRPARTGTYSIYRMDVETGRKSLVYSETKHDNVQAIVLAPRHEPDGHSSVVDEDQNWSKLYCLSTNISDLKREWMMPGIAKRIRVVEGLPRVAQTSPRADNTAATQAKPGIGNADSLSGLAQKRILGETELDEDGSFHLLVPPNTPMQLQLLDESGLAIRTTAWIWTKNKENRGCIGCHEDGELAPENTFAKALGHAAVDLMLPVSRRRTVDFARDIQPILQAKCASCHDESKHTTADSLSRGKAFSKTYLHLFEGMNANGRGKYVDPGRARTSRLVWVIYGKNTSRPWEGIAAGAVVKAMPPAGSPALTEDEKRAIAEWIDLGAQFTPLPSHPVDNGFSKGQR